MDDTGRAIAGAYRRAGEDYLAFRLERMFRNIVTEQDKASHNNMLEEILLMIGEEPERKKSFFSGLAHKLLQKRTIEKKRRLFSKMVATSIISISKG